jgi:hypothetical protein
MSWGIAANVKVLLQVWKSLLCLPGAAAQLRNKSTRLKLKTQQKSVRRNQC